MQIAERYTSPKPANPQLFEYWQSEISDENGTPYFSRLYFAWRYGHVVTQEELASRFFYGSAPVEELSQDDLNNNKILISRLRAVLPDDIDVYIITDSRTYVMRESLPDGIEVTVNGYREIPRWVWQDPAYDRFVLPFKALRSGITGSGAWGSRLIRPMVSDGAYRMFAQIVRAQVDGVPLTISQCSEVNNLSTSIVMRDISNINSALRRAGIGEYLSRAGGGVQLVR